MNNVILWYFLRYFNTIRYYLIFQWAIAIIFRAPINLSKLITMKYQTRLLLIASIVVFTNLQSINCHPSFNTTEGCDCASTELVSTDGIEDTWGRFTGNWYTVGDYDSFPYYMCIIDCQGLPDKLVSHNILIEFFSNLKSQLFYKIIWK